jgi:hypothetical protein
VKIVLPPAQYRPGGQDVATDQALQATTNITQSDDASGIAGRRISG